MFCSSPLATGFKNKGAHREAKRKASSDQCKTEPRLHSGAIRFFTGCCWLFIVCRLFSQPIKLAFVCRCPLFRSLRLSSPPPPPGPLTAMFTAQSASSQSHSAANITHRGSHGADTPTSHSHDTADNGSSGTSETGIGYRYRYSSSSYAAGAGGYSFGYTGSGATGPTSAQQQSHYLYQPTTSTASASSNPATMSRVPQPQNTPISTGLYSHNALTACLWLPCWCILFVRQESTVPLQTFGILALVLYGFDLANLKEGVFYMLWIASLLQSLVSMWFRLLSEGDNDDAILTVLLGSVVESLFHFATSCWFSLQLQWLVVNDNSGNDSSSSSSKQFPRQLETALHAVLPIVATALITEAVTDWIWESYGPDSAATSAPHAFSLMLTIAILSMASAPTCFATGVHRSSNPTDNSSVRQRNSDEVVYAIPKRVAQWHLCLLLFTPGSIHVVTFLKRIASRYASTDDLCDLLLVVTIPYLLHSFIETLHASKLFASPHGETFLNRNQSWTRQFFPLFASAVASLALQQRYLIPLCRHISYQFMGHQSPAWLLNLYWLCATASGLGSFWLWGRLSPSTGQLFFGEYHEDIVQLLLALAGLSLGKAVGLPWNMTPLPVLGILGLSLWISTRMLRYLMIFLFVLHATAVIIFTYRFVGIEQTLSLPFPEVDLTLMRFGMLITVSSILVGLVGGFAVRSSGGFMASTLRKIDVAGLVLICYSAVLVVLEIALWKRPVPTKELSGVEVEEEDGDDRLYEPILVYLTSGILIAISLYMSRIRILHDRSASLVLSLALGKSVAVFIEASGAMPNSDTRGTSVLGCAGVAALLSAVMVAPRVFLEPVHLKNTVRNRRSTNNAPDLPANVTRFVGIYAFLFLPMILVATLPYVLFPFVNALARTFTHVSYYQVSTPVTEYIGPTLSIWSLAMLSMLNHYLPNGGGESWKKFTALVFIMSIGIFFTAPTIGMSIGVAGHSPYASVSSLGSQLILRGKSRTGGWGILSAALATLLALTGPLELKARKHSSGRKDKYLLFRTMTFSLLFGCGAAWFITVQNMSESDWLFLVLTMMASMALAFLGTIAAVLGFFVEQDNFDEVEQISRTWLMGLVAFLPIAGIPQAIRSDAEHPLGTGGWLSTYLTVASVSAISFAVSLSSRQGKDNRTRGLGNVGCVVAWLSAIIVLYGRYGVAGLDSKFDVSTVFGVPASVFGTIAFSPILLILEGEVSVRSRRSRMTMSTLPGPMYSMNRLNFPQLTRSNRWFPPLFGTIAVFLCVSLYAILLRGSGFLWVFGVSAVRSHADVFASVVAPSAKSHLETADLANLANKAISESMVLSTSARLSVSGFWTSSNFFLPMLHLVGVAAMIPSLFLLVNQYWFGITVISSQITFCLPLNAIPVLLCRGIPSLRVAALITVVSALFQLLIRRQSEQASKIRI